MEPNSIQRGPSMAVTITLKNIPENLYQKLKERAAFNHRSINREMIAIMQDTLNPSPIDPSDFLSRARELRAQTSKVGLVQDEIDRAKNEGRP